MKTESITIPKEYERRFFPDLATFTCDTFLYSSVLITQAYLEDEMRTRIRDELDLSTYSHTYTQTRKTGEGVSRGEAEHEITKHEYVKLLQRAACSLVKRRYFMPWGKYTVQVNFFEGPLGRYIQIEVEFASEEEANAFIPPEWFGVEVTDDKRHDNYSLAKYGCKELL